MDIAKCAIDQIIGLKGKKAKQNKRQSNLKNLREG